MNQSHKQFEIVLEIDMFLLIGWLMKVVFGLFLNKLSRDYKILTLSGLIFENVKIVIYFDNKSHIYNHRNKEECGKCKMNIRYYVKLKAGHRS